MNEYEKLHLLALANTPGIGAVTVRHLINFAGSPSLVYSLGFKKLVRVRGVGDKIAREILKKESVNTAESEWSRCGKEGISLLFFGDERYPERLKPLYDAPAVLYVKGDADLNARYSIGIIGTRKISEYGKQLTESIVQDLSPLKPLIVSGLAYGVDITAHRASLKNQLSTAGVMANGLDLVYPAAHRKTSQEMVSSSGALLTESPLGTKPDYMRFPARNRVIAGMCDVILVVESAGKGGSLITASFAQNYHREVFAVPGNLTNAQSEGCNSLIRDHKATMFTSVARMTESIGWTADQHRDPVDMVQNEPIHVFSGFTHEETLIISLLKKKREMELDILGLESGIPAGRLANLLLHLEFEGMIRMLPGKKYQLI